MICLSMVAVDKEQGEVFKMMRSGFAPPIPQNVRYGLSEETELKHINFDLTGLKTMEYSITYCLQI